MEKEVRNWKEQERKELKSELRRDLAELRFKQDRLRGYHQGGVVAKKLSLHQLQCLLSDMTNLAFLEGLGKAIVEEEYERQQKFGGKKE